MSVMIRLMSLLLAYATSPGDEGEAFWTGRMHHLRVRTAVLGVSCEYLAGTHRFWNAFPGRRDCPVFQPAPPMPPRASSPVTGRRVHPR